MTAPMLADQPPNPDDPPPCSVCGNTGQRPHDSGSGPVRDVPCTCGWAKR